MLNKVFLVGYLGKDPELRVTPSGVQVCQFTLATSEKRRDPTTSQLVDHTEWHNIVVFGKTAESCSRYLKKGSQVFVEGKIQTRKWQDQNGLQRSTTEILATGVRFLSKAGAKEAEEISKDEEVLRALQNADEIEQDQFDEELPF
ncbi:MAG: single-stranded DNA-binding protein [Deltaproteobacteria bacterium]|nr:single-stranded DNA-binding protein [Deltaproteobacteria bacterium]MCX7953326.1 single-stranded DNA-binding protein [Deltaproteobacteria bacterium]